MAAELSSGTVDGLFAYLDYLIERGYAPASAISPWKSAVKQTFSTVEGNEQYGNMDLTTVDLDDYLNRYAVKASGTGNVKQESVVAYQRRVTKAIESYREYVNDPTSWRPPKLRASIKRSRPTPEKESNGNGHAPEIPQAHANGSTLMDYPFPLRSGQIAHVRLPVRLDKADADRLATFIRTLVFEEQRALAEHAGAS